MLLNTLVQASLQGALMIAVLFSGLKLIPSVTPKVRLWLWRIVFLKLALSLFPLGAISLKVLPEQTQPLIAQEAIYTADAADALSVPAAPTPVKPSTDGWVWAWAAGASVAGIFAVWRARSCQEAIRNAEPPTKSLATEIEDLVREIGARKTPQVVVSSEVPTAMVVGSRNPTILLPEEMQGSEDLRLILAHEVAHIAHRDLEWNAFTSVEEALYFFHPLVWLASKATQQSQEAAADAAAIRLTKSSPKRYGEMLMRATILNQFQSFSAGLSVGASTGRIRKRLQELKHVNAKPTAAKVLATAFLSLAVIAMTPAYRLSPRDPQTKSAPAVYRVVRDSKAGYTVQAKRHPKARTYRVVTRHGRHVILRSWHVVPDRHRSIVIHDWNAVGRGDNGTIYVTPATAPTAPAAPRAAKGVLAPEALDISVAPAVAPTAPSRITFTPQRVKGHRYTHPRAMKVYISPATPATRTGAALAAPESDSVSTDVEPVVATSATSISVSSIARPASVVSVATAPQVGRTLRVSAAPAVAQGLGESYSVSTVRVSPASGRTITIRRAHGTRQGFGKGSAKGSGRSSGEGSSSGFGSAAGQGSAKGSGSTSAASSSSGFGSAAGEGSGTGKG